MRQNQWHNLRLKFLFANRYGGAWGDDPKEDNSTVCIRAADIITDELRHKEYDLTYRSYKQDEINNKGLQPGDLIIEKSGGGDNQPVGRVVQFSLNQPALCSNFLELLRPNKKRLVSRFGAYLFYSLWVNRYVTLAIKQTTGIQNLDISDYLDFKVNLPELDRQEEIASYLDRETAYIDSLIHAKEKLLAMLAEKRRALITQAVTRGLNPDVQLKPSGIYWLGDVPEHWDVERLKFHLRGIEQGWSPQCDNVPAEEHEWGVLKAGCVNGWDFDPSQNKRLPSNLEPIPAYEVKERDVLMSRANTRNLLGSASLVNNVRLKLMISDKLYRLNVNEANLIKEYLLMFLAIPVGRYEFERDATGASSSMQNISQDSVRNLWLPIPPKEEQFNIVAFITLEAKKLDAIQEAAKQSINILKERRSALITAVATGQIDVTYTNGNQKTTGSRPPVV